ncbi:MAG: 50S ribosomal protein L25 [Thermoleophilia bacterium]|jgi:large subunit ribosomal protein L25|nr:50S ribosomal protein L25 [Thermoleophilia bacterium]
MDTFKMAVRERDTSGKGPARRMRVAGQVPAVVYGRGLETVSLTLDLPDLREALRHGHNVVLELRYGAGRSNKHYAVIKEMQRSPARNVILHVDLHEIDLNMEIEAAVAVELVGTARGTQDGGVLDHQHREVRVRALPTTVPESLQFDVSELGIGDRVTIADLVAPEGVTFLADPGLVIATILAPRVATEEELLEDEAAAAAKAAAVAGEAEAEAVEE